MTSVCHDVRHGHNKIHSQGESPVSNDPLVPLAPVAVLAVASAASPTLDHWCTVIAEVVCVAVAVPGTVTLLWLFAGPSSPFERPESRRVRR